MDIQKKIDPATLENCYKSWKEDIKNIFTPSELTEMKDEIFKVNKEKMHSENALKLVKTALTEQTEETAINDLFDELRQLVFDNKGIKQLTTEFKELMKKCSNGYEITEQLVYGFDYQDDGIMAVYDADGCLIYKRDLYQSERQVALHSYSRMNKDENEDLTADKTGTND
jgi:hypothetical protein